jgi:hypothetical protein
MTEPETADASAGRGAAELEHLAATLKPAQRKVLAELASRGSEELTRAEYERIGIVSRSQAAYDLAELVQMGLLERIGAGRATHYRLAHPGAGRKRKWTEERIRAELEAFCAGRRSWPRALEFKQEGHADLYLAASRYGGIDYWAAELGYEEPEPVPEPPPERVWPSARDQLRRVGRLAFAVVAGLVVALAVGLGLRSDATDRTPLRAAAPGAPILIGRSAAPEAVNMPAPTKRGRPTLTLRASGGSSWVAVRRDSSSGRVLYMGTLAEGRAIRLRSERFWIRLTVPGNVVGRLDGRALEFPDRMIAGIVTSRGLRVTEMAPKRILVVVQQYDSGYRAPASGTGGSAPPPVSPAPPPSPPPPPTQSGGPARPSPDTPPAGPTPDPPPAQR